MKYIGIQSQINKNNRNSILLLLSFPCIILGLVWLFFALYESFSSSPYDNYNMMDRINSSFLGTAPFIIIGVGIWFAIAYFFNTSMIQKATGARPLTRMENPRIYNIVENLCMTCGMDMPKINVVDDPQLNAYASGINKDTYTVTVTTGICDRLTDEELAGVIGHELTHIRNNDTKVLITSIVFVGIVSASLNILVNNVTRIFYYSSGNNRRSNIKGEGNSGAGIMIAIVIAIICTAIAYLFTTLTRFAISRKREFMADAGGAELCGNPLALASALRKISGDPGLDNVSRSDVAQLFICKPDELKEGFLEKSFSTLFSTHPDTKERIRILEQF